MSHLFAPMQLKQLTIRNRVGLSPMSMYSAREGVAGHFDAVHYGARAMGGAGLVFTGTVAVLPEGRITPKDPGLWHDHQIDGLARVADSIKAFGATPGIQIGHAGRKASTTVPWQGGGPKQDGRSLTAEEGAWQTVGPMPEAYGGDKDHLPQTLDEAGIQQVIQAFGDAAERAHQAGFEVLEIHAGHGYLLNQFYSPLTNHREDQWGGSLGNRLRLTLAVLESVRRHWPADKPLVLRMAMEDFHPGGWTVAEAIDLAKRAVNLGVDAFDLMSFGAIAPGAQVPWDKPFTREHAKALKAALPGTIVMFSAQSAPDMQTPAESIAELVDSGDADIVLMGRQLLADPHWPAKAAAALGDEQVWLPNHYEHWLTGRSTETGKEQNHAAA